MNNALWIAQGVAAIIFILTGTLKLAAPKDKLVSKMHWAATWPPALIKLLGLAEVAGALGLVLPGMLHIVPAITSLAALCLAVLMLGAVQTHRSLQERAVPALVLALVCLAIAAGRYPVSA